MKNMLTDLPSSMKQGVQENAETQKSNQTAARQES
jgi:hypothetical protein